MYIVWFGWFLWWYTSDFSRSGLPRAALDPQAPRSETMKKVMNFGTKNFEVHYSPWSILHGYKLILTSLLVSMGISTFTSKEFVIFCRVSGWLAMYFPWSSFPPFSVHTLLVFFFMAWNAPEMMLTPQYRVMFVEEICLEPCSSWLL